MSWKQTLDEACRLYDNKDYETARERAVLALLQAASVQGPEGLKAAREIESWVAQLDQKIKEENKGKPPKPRGNTPSYSSSSSSAADMGWTEILVGLGCGGFGYFITQTALKDFIKNLHLPESYSGLDGWLQGAATAAVVISSLKIGRGIGKFLGDTGSGAMEDLGRLANKVESGLQESNNGRNGQGIKPQMAQSTVRAPRQEQRKQAVWQSSRPNFKLEGAGIGVGIAVLLGILCIFSADRYEFGRAVGTAVEAIIGYGMIFGCIGAGIGSFIRNGRESFSLGEGMRRVKKRKLDLHPEWVHIRTHQNMYFDDMWLFLRKYFDNTRTSSGRKWEVPQPNLDEGRIDIHADCKLDLSLSDGISRSVGECNLHLHGIILISQIRPGAVRLEFRWIPELVSPGGAKEEVPTDGESVVDKQVKLHWQRLYSDFDANIGKAKIGPRG